MRRRRGFPDATSVSVLKKVLLYTHSINTNDNMALTTRAARTLACSSCRQSVLRSFIASIGATTTTTTTITTTTTRRSFAALTTRWRVIHGEEHAINDINVHVSPNEHKTGEVNTQRSRERDERRVARKAATTTLESDEEIEVTGEQLQEMQELEEAIAAEEAEKEKAQAMLAQEDSLPAPEPESGQQEQHMPWYLQLNPPPTEQSPLSPRQAIPPIPDHSPEILPSLLDWISVTLGIDDLTLMDLRALDPPPALGANLIMIIGTARSEKHLHVSADGLCRWLRASSHNITPTADGLLGRQELKVKLRRRAKRARLMSAVGGKGNETELEEGIRTGWVCVNLGRLKGGELPLTQAEEEAQKKIVGFGSRTNGCHVVVQLMTEEKRGEMDLEKLWMGILNRSLKAKEDLMKNGEEEGQEEVENKMDVDAVEDGGDDGKVVDEGKVVDGKYVPFSPAFAKSTTRRNVRA